MVWPLHAQILTGEPTSRVRLETRPGISLSPAFSLKLDWNLSGGLDGTITRVDPITGAVLDPITGAGTVQSRRVLIEFPGYGDFRGRMSKDGSVVKGRLLFRENPTSRPVVRRFTLYRYGGLGVGTGAGSSSASLTIKLVLSQAVGSVSSGDIDLGTVSPAGEINPVVQPIP